VAIAKSIGDSNSAKLTISSTQNHDCNYNNQRSRSLMNSDLSTWNRLWQCKFRTSKYRKYRW